MTEDDAKAWAATRFGEEAMARLAQFAAMVVKESAHQNLIAASTLHHIWSRHIVDSLQLIDLAPGNARNWLDIGTGAGFPGLAIAIVKHYAMTLTEPRARRADFLAKCCATLDLAHVTTIGTRVETLPAAKFDVISARAVDSVGALLLATNTVANATTRYLLPRGRSATAELESVTLRWQGSFHVEQSLTDTESGIVVATGVRRT